METYETGRGIDGTKLSESPSRCASTTARMRMLVAIDSSQQSRWASEFAGELALNLSARVILIHVMPTPSPFAEQIPGFAPTNDADEQLLVLEAQARLPESVPSDTSIRRGDPAAEIIRAAEDWGADMIVMGSHGRGRIAQLLLGSTADAVIRKSRRPVVLVSNPPSKSDAPVVDESVFAGIVD